MPSYSTRSKNNLVTAHADLQTLFNYVIKYVDCTILYGHRTPKEQYKLFMIGRKMVDGKPVITGDVVTYCDGFEKLSDHNSSPSMAVDCVPYPINFKDTDRLRYFAGYVMGIAKMLKQYNAIDHDVVSGLDWDSDFDLSDQRLKDAPHFAIKL